MVMAISWLKMECQFYTRSGNLYLDEEGAIVNSDGLYLGEMGNKIVIDPTSQSFSIGTNGTINIVQSDGTLNSDQKFQVAVFANPEGLTKVGSNLFQASSNSGIAEFKDPRQKELVQLNLAF